LRILERTQILRLRQLTFPFLVNEFFFELPFVLSGKIDLLRLLIILVLKQLDKLGLLLLVDLHLVYPSEIYHFAHSFDETIRQRFSLLV
jgi:hypothetical protein